MLGGDPLYNSMKEALKAQAMTKKQKRSLTVHVTNLHQNVTGEDLELLIASSTNSTLEVAINLEGRSKLTKNSYHHKDWTTI